MNSTISAVFERRGDWYIGYSDEIPGANVQEKTLEQARESLREAIGLILEANRMISRREREGQDVICEQLVISD